MIFKITILLYLFFSYESSLKVSHKLLSCSEKCALNGENVINDILLIKNNYIYIMGSNFQKKNRLICVRCYETCRIIRGLDDLLKLDETNYNNTINKRKNNQINVLSTKNLFNQNENITNTSIECNKNEINTNNSKIKRTTDKIDNQELFLLKKHKMGYLGVITDKSYLIGEKDRKLIFIELNENKIKNIKETTTMQNLIEFSLPNTFVFVYFDYLEGVFKLNEVITSQGNINNYDIYNSIFYSYFYFLIFIYITFIVLLMIVVSYKIFNHKNYGKSIIMLQLEEGHGNRIKRCNYESNYVGTSDNNENCISKEDVNVEIKKFNEGGNIKNSIFKEDVNIKIENCILNEDVNVEIKKCNDKENIKIENCILNEDVNVEIKKCNDKENIKIEIQSREDKESSDLKTNVYFSKSHLNNDENIENCADDTKEKNPEATREESTFYMQNNEN